MALGADERTEPATPRRKEEARKKGQVARSQELPAAVALLIPLCVLYVVGDDLWQAMEAILRTALTADAPPNPAEVPVFLKAIGRELLWRLGPLLLIVFAAILGSLLAQVGLLLTLHPLTPSLSKINPLSGIQRLFSMRMLMTTAINLAKLVLVVTIVVLTLRDRSAEILFALTLGASDVLLLGAHLTFELGIRLAVVLFVLALADFAWQRFRHSQDLRMTKEEVKDEYRSMEGDPKLKARRRQVQMQLAMQRLRKDMAKADVVISNPTHVAVAIQYDATEMPAPQVVAKGADYAALRIRQLASEYGIPVVERPPLARAVFASVEVGQYIPERFYRAIAEILAYVYELTGRSPVRAA
ncbi:MAG: flagellar biosynthesis protein FlhB [Phycisphaerae bacterium]|nr:flagellar biosynthesis protein FlhB [Phycisphaerae bacterium]